MAELEMIEVKTQRKDPTTGEMKDVVIAKQAVCPPDTPRYNPPWVSEREDYLFANGWEKEPNVHGGLATYKDPKGSRLNGESTYIKHLPTPKDEMNPEGKPLHQLILPCAFHTFTLEEAVETQRRRDQAGETGQTPLERVEMLESRCNNAEQEIIRIKQAVKALVMNTQMPPPLLRLALRRVFGWDVITDHDHWK